MLFLLILALLGMKGVQKDDCVTDINQDWLLVKTQVFLPACVKDSTCQMIADTIKAGVKHYKHKKSDYNSILAVIRMESFGQHIPGRGEWGMLQVVPWEGHIMKLTQQYKCIEGDLRCKDGSPDVNKRGRINSKLVRLFLKSNARAALFIGIGELQISKYRFNKRYKYRFWGWRRKGGKGLYPGEYIKRRLKAVYKEEASKLYVKTERWWYKVTAGLKDNLWIVHHNYGGQIRVDKIGLSYPLKFMKFMRMLKRIDNN